MDQGSEGLSAVLNTVVLFAAGSSGNSWIEPWFINFGIDEWNDSVGGPARGADFSA